MHTGSSSGRWLAAVVVLHLVLSIAHGAAHRQAAVPLSDAGTIFVFVVILAGPLAGLGLMWAARAAGAWMIAATLAGSLAFGAVNHFLIAGVDHVAHVAGPWRGVFSATALGLAVTEALGAALALRIAYGARGRFA